MTVLLLSTVSLSWYGIHRCFSFAKNARFDGLDFFLTSSQYDLWDIDYIASLIKEFEVPVLSLTVSIKWMDEKKVDRILNIASQLWVQVITFSPPHFSDKNTQWFSKYLTKMKRELHTSIAVQNVGSKFIFFIIPEYKNATLSEIKKVTGDTSLSLADIDTSSGLDILKAYKILWGSVKNVFLSDKRGGKAGLLPWNAGGGISYLPLESFFMKLKTSWYNGFVTLKVRPSELGVWNEETVLKNLDYVRNYYMKHFLNFKW